MSDAYNAIFGETDGLATLEALAEPTAPAPEPAAPEVVAETPEPAPAENSDDVRVPLPALEAERRKRQELEAELKSFKEATPPKEPDPVDLSNLSPEQYLGMQLLNNKLQMSETIARDKHGDELVDKMMEWSTARMESDPAYAKKIFAHRHPYQAAIDEYNANLRVQAAAVGNDLSPDQIQEAIRLYRDSKGGPPASPETTTQTPAPAPVAAITPPVSRRPAPPPQSIASAPPAAGTSPTNEPVGAGQAFAKTFT